MELLAEKSKLQIRTQNQEIEYTVNNRIKNIFHELKNRTSIKRLEVFDYEDECVEDGEEDDMSA